MSNITHTVWKFLDDNPNIRREMNRGLINISALARYILKEKKISASLDSAIIAIRRYELDQHNEIFNNAQKLLGKIVNLTTKNNLAEISLIKDSEVQRILPKIFGIINYVQGDVLRIMQANKSIRLLFDEKDLEKVSYLFPKEKILTVDKELAEINIFIHPKMQETPGILAIIANELTINNINIVEFVTCPPEMLVIIKKEDLLKASEILYNLFESSKAN